MTKKKDLIINDVIGRIDWLIGEEKSSSDGCYSCFLTEIEHEWKKVKVYLRCNHDK